jgi:hypothetical protein
MLPVDNVVLLAVVLDQQARFAKVVSRQAGEQVVSHLEMQAAVNELDIWGTHDIHGGPELPRGEGLGRSEVLGGAGEV